MSKASLKKVADSRQLVQTGTCVYVEGVLAIPPVGAGIKQKIELRVKKVIDVGLVAAEYPLSRKSTILSI
ncbi:hypothetical protein CICLE_v10003532mg [Citrus x clementina]|uniref:Uncharacterized protein n=1 Tax=Citrus clementina TaxID=85681 RepID=V4T2W9_CITCL|nr:hypothetical protein CICLE_v10003532mg [Citrus x clementina]